jgi:general stress protein YciG
MARLEGSYFAAPLRSSRSYSTEICGTIIHSEHLWIVALSSSSGWVGMDQVKSNRGFASMDRARQREIASKGGHGVPPEKRSFSKNRQLAAEAGRKGGEAVPAGERSFSQNRELAATAGRKGGESRALLFNPHPDLSRQRGAKDEKDEEEKEEITKETA